jgi:50S ribosomal protein L16 3-hydroxylase
MELLGGMSARVFLRDHWQKRPLLVRQAVPDFRGLVDRDQVLALANRSDANSKLILKLPRGRWESHEGPFVDLRADALPTDRWTVLVHGLESLVPGGWEVLSRFSFLPAARIEDLMVSYAADGGTVGPHDDRYDVFLLQGPGRRRWQISSQRQRTFDRRAPIRVLDNFVPEAEWLLEPGDMLYLPPGVAHHGVAEGPCFTYSIGFLAPSHKALLGNFLGYLADSLVDVRDDRDLYADPELRVPTDPLEVPSAMITRVTEVLRDLRWTPASVGEFLGRFLTGPKPHVVFPAPSRPPDHEVLARRLRGRGRLSLALPSRGLTRGRRIFLNGESHAVSPAMRTLFRELVRSRSVALPIEVDEGFLGLIARWVALGYMTTR